jgi:hypothetical protein
MEISEKKKTCNYYIWTRSPIYNCSRTSRACKASLSPINRPLAFEEKDTQALRKNQRLHQERGFFFIVFIFFLLLYYFLMRMIFIQIMCN